MFRFLCTKLLQLRGAGESSTHLSFFRNSSLTSISNATNQPSLTVDYLINSCGLSSESALKAAQQISLKTTTNPNAVLALFENYGFTNPHITTLITKRPSLLLANPDKTLKPKLDFLRNMGISGPNLAKILSRDPTILGTSLEREIIPSLNFLRSFIPIDGDIALILSRLRWSKPVPKIMGPNIEILRNHGVPNSSISKLVLRRPQLLAWKVDRFNEIVLEIKEMGFDPSNLMFIHGLCALSRMKRSNWQAKLAIFRSFGCSEDEILSMIRNQPYCMSLSEKRIRERIDFFMNKPNCTVADIVRYPALLLYSMENRIVPRLYVLQVLLSKGLVRKESMCTALRMTENVFLKKFVIKYQEQLPQLLEVYQSKMGSLGQEIVSEEGGGIGNL